MGREAVKFKIDKNEYVFTQLDPRKGSKLFLWLLSLTGAPLGKAVGSLKQGKGGKGILDAEADFDSIGLALEALLSKADNPEVESKIDIILDTVLYNAQPLNMDSLVFQGNILHMFKVIKKALEVNFSDFLDVSRGVSAAVQKVMVSMSEKQTSAMKTGSSGDQSLPDSAA